MYSTWLAMSLIRLPKVPDPEAGCESRTRMRKPSESSSMYLSRTTAAASNFSLVCSPPRIRVAIAEQPLDLAVHHHRVEAFLAAEVLVDHRLGHARLRGDLLDGGALESAFREQPPADVQQLLAAFFSGHPLA